jgi:myosin heavy subunit
MDNLLYIDEITIDRCIHILSERFKNKKIYTQLGGVLLSINPYQYFTGNDNIYQLDNSDTAHLFRTMDKVYEGMLNGENQTIIVSGESGSGKTETTKQMIQYLNHYNGNDGNNLLEKIEASGLVLEMFGNAATEKNHNSSRFGKFIELYYKEKECIGMTTNVYLLEKTRVLIPHGRFHVFNKYSEDVRFVLEKAGFLSEQITFILKIVELVEEIGKLQFGNITNPLYKELLTRKKINIQDETIEKIYTETEFNELRDTISMKLYEFLFLWLVEQMNNFYQISNTSGLLKIGVLDIFGFENLKTNKLEQLCINYANEIIQGLLNKILLEDKIKLYKEEQIPIDTIPPKLNSQQIDLVEKIFIALDEECMLPKGSNTSFIQKINLQFMDNSLYGTNKLTCNKCFQIDHYAGKIEYSVNEFIQFNLDRQNIEIDNFIHQLFIEVGLEKKKKRGIGKLKIHSISNQFRNNLADFIQTVQTSRLHFIKCIKPNDNEKPMEFINDLVKEQLIYNGVIQLITILKQGYSCHFNKDIFYKDYGEFILDSDKEEYVVGTTRIFMTDDYYKIIKNRYHTKQLDSIVILQKNCLRNLAFRGYQTKKIAFNVLENRIWSSLLKQDYHINRSAYRIQRFFHSIIHKKEQYKKYKAQLIIRFIKFKIEQNKYTSMLSKLKKGVAIIDKNRIRREFIKKRLATLKIQQWWKIYLRKKGDILQQNQFLEESLYQRDRKIVSLECRILELEKRLSRSTLLDRNIIHERDHYIISLKKDIECYQKNIEERLREKLELIESIDKLKTENKILISQLGNVRNRQGYGWLSRFFN